MTGKKVTAALLASSALLFAHSPAHAQQRNFDLPEGKAVETLPVFALQSGLQIVAPSSPLRSTRTPRLHGSYDARQALKHIIEGTNLFIASDHNNVVTLRDKDLRAGMRQINYMIAEEQGGGSSAVPADTPATAEQEEIADDIVVVGSQIRGAKTTGALPVNLVGAEQIEAVAAVSGADLYRSIPQLGGVTFNEQVLGGGSANAARGDVSTVSLRGLGQGNTLLLINGRRTVLHPTSQAITGVIDSGVPTFGFNANAVPVGAIERVEVLRDGAAALYGSDAVAGVVNNVLKSNFKGFKVDAQYGGAESTNLREFQVNGLLGFDFAGGRGNISIFGGYAHKTKLYKTDQDYTANVDLRPELAGTSFANVAAFNGTSTGGPWGSFQATGTGIITSNGAQVTNASRQFHNQPSTNPDCRAATSVPGICYDAGLGTTEMANVDANLRFDSNKTYPTLTVQPSVDRYNVFSFVNYDFTDTLSFFGEAGFYRGKTQAITPAGGSLANIPITVSKNAYWNPFGAVGSPNRLPGLNIPAAGLDVTIRSLTLIDTGPRLVEVTNDQYRLLGGLRGNFGDFNWESAALYTWATAKDTMDTVSNTLFQAAVNKTTADAYNPFRGGSLEHPSYGSGVVNDPATIDSVMVKATRKTKTTLALWDLKVSNAGLLDLWAGNSIGIATGVEVRRETYKDDRDPRQGGIANSSDITYTDAVTGIFYGSDVMGASPSPDVFGKRTVWSVYGELAIPLVNPDMGIPLIRAFDVQLAGRYENYSDVGDVAKPKIAASWDILKGVRVRGSWSQGFRAPNLEVINTATLDRVNTGTEYVLCEADLRAGRIANFSQCQRSVSVLRRSGGNPNLKPEESTSWNVGAVLQPPLPSGWGNLTFTVDRWRIKQEGVVGLLDYQNALNIDYLLRAQGSSNPSVIRDAPTADDAALVAGTGLAPVGRLLYVTAPFENLLPIQVDGIDFTLDYSLRNTTIGSFSFNANASHLIKYFVDVPQPVNDVIAGQQAGIINAAVPIQGGGDIIGRDGQPGWRFSADIKWSMGPVAVGAFTQFIDDVYQNDVFDASNKKFIVKGQTTVNLYVQFTLPDHGFSKGTVLTFGARNIFNEDPPLASGGYLSSLYQPQARYWYTGIKKTF